MKDKYINENPTIQERGWFISRERWYSICSIHYVGKIGCKMCHSGEWRNKITQSADHIFFKLTPTLWMKWQNRKNSPSRKNLERIFPNLRRYG